MSCRSSTRFNAGKFSISPPLAILGVKSLAFFAAVSIEVASFMAFLKSKELEFVRCLRHTVTDYVTSLLRYSENHNVLKGKYPKPLSLFSHTPEVMTHRILKREMYKTLIFPLAFGLERNWPIGTSFNGLGAGLSLIIMKSKVETRREEPGYEVGPNLDSSYFLTILAIFEIC